MRFLPLRSGAETCFEKGFSIIEVLIAISVFSIGFMAVIAVLWSSSSNMRTTFFCDQAVFAGQEAMELLSAMNIEEVEAVKNPVEIRSWQIERDICSEKDVNGDGYPDFKTIELRVYPGPHEGLNSEEFLMKTYYRATRY